MLEAFIPAHRNESFQKDFSCESSSDNTPEELKVRGRLFVGACVAVSKTAISWSPSLQQQRLGNNPEAWEGSAVDEGNPLERCSSVVL